MFSSKKPYSAVTVQIDRLTSEQYEEDDISGVFDLVEVIRIQASGPTEAARALRKKLKYGNPHRQVRALVLLDGLMENGGSRFQRSFVDEPLLERLRLLPREDITDPTVRKKCDVLFRQWAADYKNKPGMERIATLYKDLPKSKRPQAARQRVIQQAAEDPFDSEYDPPEAAPSRTPAAPASSATPAASSSSKASRPVALNPTSSSTFSSSKLSKHKKSSSTSKSFSLSKEKDNITKALAEASIASTNLLNGLQLINREAQRVSENPEVVQRFEICKALRRRILYYIQHVESDDWIGSLVNANDELVKALTAYEITDRSIDDDSDSDAWESPPDAPGQPTGATGGPSAEAQQQLAGLSIAQEAPPTKPPRPTSIPIPPKPPVPTVVQPPVEDEDDEAEDDPFGDSNAAPTPYQEKSGMTWREV